MDQSVLNRAVNIATKAALNNRPVRHIEWVPPKTGADSPDGSFVIIEYEYKSAGDTLPWDL